MHWFIKLCDKSLCPIKEPKILAMEVISCLGLVKWKSLSHVWLFATPMDCPWNSPGQNTGVGSLSVLQEIFPTQGWNPSLLHCRRILYQLSHQGSIRILQWVAYPFSSRSSQSKNPTGVSSIAGRFFTNCAFREALYMYFFYKEFSTLFCDPHSQRL